MRFSDWEPIYQQILDDFGFDRSKDELAAEILKDMLKIKETLLIEELTEAIRNNKIFIFGAGPGLDDDIKKFGGTGVLISADGATSALIENDIIPDIIVTDLDGYIPHQLQANEQGAKVIIHAHGDNIPALKRWVPEFKNNILGTTQAKPDEKNGMYNFGGFTDGDRAIFLASHFEAKQINLIAFDFKKVSNNSYKSQSDLKFRKLTWANLLIGMIVKPAVIMHNVESK